jgi:hypothetical protein
MKKNSNDEEDRIVLDCKDEDGISASDDSEDDDEGDGESGEFDMEEGEMELDDFDLDSETKRKFQDGTITNEELEAMGVNNISDYGEEGE